VGWFCGWWGGGGGGWGGVGVCVWVCVVCVFHNVTTAPFCLVVKVSYSVCGGGVGGIFFVGEVGRANILVCLCVCMCVVYVWCMQ